MTRRIALTTLAIVVGACRPAAAPPPPADELAQLRQQLADAERATRLARAGCELLAADQRPPCLAAVDQAVGLLAKGQQAVSAVETCREAQDEVCALAALGTLRDVLRRARGEAMQP